MAPHSSTFAWKIPWTEEPGGLQFMGSIESDTTERLHFHFHALEKEMATHSSVLAWRIPGTGSLVGCHLWGRTESNMTEATQQQQQQQLVWLWRLRRPIVWYLEAGNPGKLAMWLSESESLKTRKQMLWIWVQSFGNRGADGLSCRAQLCLTLCDPMDCHPPGSSIPGIFQARILEWVAISYSRGPSWPRDWTCVSPASVSGFFATEPPRSLGTVLVQVQKLDRQEHLRPRAGEKGCPSSSRKGKSPFLHHVFSV